MFKCQQFVTFNQQDTWRIFKFFGMDMPFISSSEAKNACLISGEATNETYIFSLHEMK